MLKDKTTEPVNRPLSRELDLDSEGADDADGQQRKRNKRRAIPQSRRCVDNPRSRLGCELEFFFFEKATEGGVSE